MKKIFCKIFPATIPLIILGLIAPFSTAAATTLSLKLIPDSSTIMINSTDNIAIKTTSGGVNVGSANVALSGAVKTYQFPLTVKLSDGFTINVNPNPTINGSIDINQRQLVYTAPSSTTIKNYSTTASNIKLSDNGFFLFQPTKIYAQFATAAAQKSTNSACASLNPLNTTTNSSGDGSTVFTAPANPSVCVISGTATKTGYTTDNYAAEIQINGTAVPMGTVELRRVESDGATLFNPPADPATQGSIDGVPKSDNPYTDNNVATNQTHTTAVTDLSSAGYTVDWATCQGTGCAPPFSSWTSGASHNIQPGDIPQNGTLSVVYRYTKTQTATLDANLSLMNSATPAPFDALLKAQVLGTATGSIDYTFWWNCNDAINTDINKVEGECGTVPTPAAGQCAFNDNGFKCGAVTGQTCSITSADKTTGIATYSCVSGPAILQSIPHTYQNSNTFYFKAIIRRGG